MNPPFENHQDIQHVYHAYGMLNTGGKMIAIVCESAFYNDHTICNNFRKWLDVIEAHVERINAKHFNGISSFFVYIPKKRMLTFDNEGQLKFFWDFSYYRRIMLVKELDLKKGTGGASTRGQQYPLVSIYKEHLGWHRHIWRVKRVLTKVLTSVRTRLLYKNSPSHRRRNMETDPRLKLIYEMLDPWLKNNPETVQTGVEHRKKEMRKTCTSYGITPDDWMQLMVEQNGRCAICGVPEYELPSRLYIDHDHETGKVRGLLCPSCNTGLGHLKDDPEVLLRACIYLLTKGKE